MPLSTLSSRLTKLLMCSLSALALGVNADTRTYQATTDFPVIDAGDAPYYSEAPGRPSLAINAAIEDFRDVFARAEVVYDGNAGLHDFTLIALAELDGEADYRLLINGEIVGTATNPEVAFDYTVVRHSFPDIDVPSGAVIAVESLANTNGEIPEGDGTAYARGRWTALEMIAADDESSSLAATTIDLDVTLTSDRQTVGFNQNVELDVDISNAADSLTATQPAASLTLPSEIVRIISAEQCSPAESGLRCIFPELPAGSSHTMQLVLSTNDETTDWVTQATVSADQDDRDASNNTANITINIVDDALVPEPMTVTTPQTDSAQISNTGNSSSGGGAFSIFWLLFAPVLIIKHSRRGLRYR